MRGVRLRRTTLVAWRGVTCGACPLLLRISLLAFLGFSLPHSLRHDSGELSEQCIVLDDDQVRYLRNEVKHALRVACRSPARWLQCKLVTLLRNELRRNRGRA